MEEEPPESENSIQGHVPAYPFLMDDLYATLPSEMRVLQTTESDIVTPHTQQGKSERLHVQNVFL